MPPPSHLPACNPPPLLLCCQVNRDTLLESSCDVKDAQDEQREKLRIVRTVLEQVGGLEELVLEQVGGRGVAGAGAGGGAGCTWSWSRWGGRG